MNRQSVDDKIRLAKEHRSTILDLSEHNIAAVPEGLAQLTDLERLDLSRNAIRTLPALWRQTSAPRWVDLRFNPVESVPDMPGLLLDWVAFQRCQATLSFGHVSGLRLGAAYATVASDLGKFRNLSLLDLSAYGEFFNGEPPVIAAIPSSIERLIGLQTLILSYNAIRQLPSTIGALKGLETLALTGNPLGTVPPSLRELRALKRLDLGDTGLQQLPEWLWELDSLESLVLDFNQIRELPPAISQLRSLRVLSAVNAGLEALPDSFSDLCSLERLVLSCNPLREIPPVVFRLPRLRELFVSGFDLRPPVVYHNGPAIRGVTRTAASIVEVPAAVLELPNLDLLDVADQPVATPPQQVVGSGLDAIRDYWRQRVEAGTDYLCEAKLLIVGEPGAGKTSLARKLQNPQYQLDPAEVSTEGVDVERWEFRTTLRVAENGSERLIERPFRVNTWDFGGQEIYHATHQFFLTHNSLYALVADARREDTDFNYWLSIVELLGGNSPLLIVANEKQERHRDINESHLRARFDNVREVLTTNLQTNRGLADVRREIMRHIEQLPHVGTPLPASWKRVRERLEQDPRNYIDAGELLEICRSHGFPEASAALRLSSYLHEIGTCLHFQDDPVLKRTVILKPRWGTNAVYRVLDSPLVRNAAGRFVSQDLEAIWSEQEYAGMRDDLLQLMIKFGLCYRLEGSNAYIAPQLLTARQPQYEWDPRNNLVVKFRYDFMPKGIVTRFIVATHHLIARPEWVWRDGVVLAKDSTRAAVVEDYSRREIVVRVAGQYPKDLMTVVAHELDRIHRTLPRLRYETLVPCNCHTCSTAEQPQFYGYDVLRRFARDNRPIQCQVSYEMVETRGLIDSVFSPSGPPVSGGTTPSAKLEARQVQVSSDVSRAREVFVSYKWEPASERVVDAVEAALGERGITLVRDKTTMHYRDSIRDFMNRLAAGACVVVVIGKDYLESRHCMSELTQIAEHKDFRSRVFPIVLRGARIYEPLDRLGYIQYWEDKITVLDREIRKVQQTNLQGIQNDLNLYSRIRTTVDELVEIVADMNAPMIDVDADADFSALIRAISDELR